MGVREILAGLDEGRRASTWRRAIERRCRRWGRHEASEQLARLCQDLEAWNDMTFPVRIASSSSVAKKWPLRRWVVARVTREPGVSEGELAAELRTAAPSSWFRLGRPCLTTAVDDLVGQGILERLDFMLIAAADDYRRSER